jgi:thioredoxin 1
MATVQITAKNFAETLQKGGIVLLDWWAPWCGPCRAFGPIFERVAAANPDIVFGKVNSDEEQALARQFNINSIPTLMIIRDSTLLFEQPGMLPEKVLADLVAQARQVDMEKVKRESAKEKSTAQAATG